MSVTWLGTDTKTVFPKYIWWLTHVVNPIERALQGNSFPMVLGFDSLVNFVEFLFLNIDWVKSEPICIECLKEFSLWPPVRSK